MKKYILLFAVTLWLPATVFSQQITPELALRLSRLPLSCIHQQWPNKTSHVSNSIVDHRLAPSELHPAFYGCLDWHSSVHGHWLLVKILKTYPDIANRDSIVAMLNSSFELAKINGEAAYFTKYAEANTFERTYGWAWLLKLDQELLSWDNPNALDWHEQLKPLTSTIVKLWKDFLPKQTYPNRTGVHPNTAFALAFALDWARAVSDTTFERMIVTKAKEFYYNNRNVPAYFEPDGSDFFSPSLEAADLMQRILSPQEFTLWFDRYYDKRSLDRLLTLPTVSDRTDYQIVHLDGLAFSRAWCLKGIAAHLYKQPQKAQLFKGKANDFIKATLPTVSHDNYGGSHWLATFAFYALQEIK